MSIMAFDIIWNIIAEHNPIRLKKKKKKPLQTYDMFMSFFATQ